MAYSFTEPQGDNSSDDEAESECNDVTGKSVDNPPMMVPMADILNHVSKHNARLVFETDCLKMVAIRDIAKVGGQVPLVELDDLDVV